MAHLFFDNLEAAINGADSVFTVDLKALNSSGGSGTVTLIRTGDTLTVAVAATGLTPGEVHLGHIHGTFDEMGNPTNATSPTIANDADGDGFVELLEGVPSYGPVILPFVDAMGNDPMADADGNVLFFATYDLTDSATFAGDFDAADIADLTLREVVLHGAVVPDGAGEGTPGEVDGGSNGYTFILPAVVGEIEAASKRAALNLVETGRDAFGLRIVGNGDANDLVGQSTSDTLIGRDGDDFISGEGGDDFAVGGSGADVIAGRDGDDVLLGSTGNDFLYGGRGLDKLVGGLDDDVLFGQGGDDILLGNDGDDKLIGGNGADNMIGGTGNDFLTGGLGDDVLRGDTGADVFVWERGGGDDVIRDLESDVDAIRIFGVDEDDVTLTDGADSVVLTFAGDTGSVTVLNTTAADLDGSIFV
jgi:Ca2+-binding RTX toxin-like protein